MNMRAHTLPALSWPLGGAVLTASAQEEDGLDLKPLQAAPTSSSEGSVSLLAPLPVAVAAGRSPWWPHLEGSVAPEILPASALTRAGENAPPTGFWLERLKQQCYPFNSCGCRCSGMMWG